VIWLYKKWRLIRRLRKECYASKNLDAVSIPDLLQNSKVVIARGNFIKIVGKTPAKMAECNSLIDEAISEGLVASDPNHFIRLDIKGEQFYGHMPFLEELLSRHTSVWSKVLIPLSTFVLGYLVRGLFVWVQHWKISN